MIHKKKFGISKVKNKFAFFEQEISSKNLVFPICKTLKSPFS